MGVEQAPRPDSQSNSRSSPASELRRWRAALAVVGVVALALRLIYLAEIAHTPFFKVLIGDGQEYDAWAQRIAGGSWIGTGAFFQAPLYPYLMAVVFTVAGHHVAIVRVLQAIGGAASCVLLCDAGRAFFGRRAGLIAGALLAIYPEAIFFDGVIQKASLDLFLMTALLALAGRMLAGPRTRQLAIFGVVLGLVILNRENARLLYPIAAAWLLVAFQSAMPLGRRLAAIGVVTAGVALVLLPVAARNYAVSGEPFLSTSQAGYNFYLGNHAGANGVFEPLVPGRGNVRAEREDQRRLAEEAEGRSLSSGEVSDYWLRRALRDISAHPGAWLALTGKKALMILNRGEFYDTESMQEYAMYSVLLRALHWLSFGLIAPLAVAGVWLTRSGWRRLWFLYATAGALLVSVVVFYVVSRYRYPAVPILLLFVGAGAAAIPAVAGEPRRWSPALVLAVATGIVAFLPMTGIVNDTHVNVGSELIQEGRAAEAVPVLQRASAIRPDDPVARYNLGAALAMSGDVESSIQQFTEAARLGPRDAQTLAGLGASLAAAGRPALALSVFERAVALDPTSARARSNHAAALWTAGQRDAAIAEYQEAVRLRPLDAGGHNNLGVALQQSGQLAGAIAQYETAVAVKPDYAEAHSNLALALAEQGRLDAAGAEFQAALRLMPESFGIHANYGDLLLRTQRPADAVAEYEAAVRLARQDANAVLQLIPRLAEAYARAGRRVDAADMLDRGLALARALHDDAIVRDLTRAKAQLAGKAGKD